MFRKIVVSSLSRSSILPGLPDYGAMSLRNIADYLPVAMVPYYRRFEFSTTEVSRTSKYDALGSTVIII